MSVNPQALLARVRELARTQLTASLASGLAALGDELMTLASSAPSPADERVLIDAIGQGQAHRDAIAAAFEQGFLGIFDRKLKGRAAAAAAGGHSFGDFTLVDDAVIDLELTLGRLARKAGGALDADQLAALAARFGELLGGPREGTANPLGPETALEALLRACDTVPAEPPVRTAILNGLEPHVALGLGRLHAAANDVLIAGGVLPQIRRVVQRSRSSPAALRGGVAGTGAPGARSPAPGAGMPPGMTMSQLMALSQMISLKDLMPGGPGAPVDLGAVFAGLMQGSPAARHYGARVLAEPEGQLFEQAMATPVHPALLEQLSQLQNVALADPGAGPGNLSAVVAQVAQGSEHHPIDQLTGELVAVVFDFLLHDRDVPDTVKAEIGRLQIVAFKAALLDRHFFARREHPLRELLTAIADAAADPQVDTGPGTPFVAALHALVDDVVANFTEDLAVFVAAREGLEARVAELRQEADKEVEGLATELAGEERGAEVRARAAAELARHAAADAPELVRRFLGEIWTDVLADAELKERSGDDGREARLALVEDLLWSVEPKQAADVPRLTALLPKLVLAVSRGMKAVEVPAERQRAFLDELMQTHTALLQAARARRAQPVPPKPAPQPAAPKPAPAAQVIPSPELAADAMLGLERGALVEFADTDPAVRAKLTWISPKRTIYLFTAHGAKARKISPRDLSAQLRAGKAALVEAGGAVVERALAAVVAEQPDAAAA